MNPYKHVWSPIWSLGVIAGWWCILCGVTRDGPRCSRKVRP